jgi:serine O-acetyltransferase
VPAEVTTVFDDLRAACRRDPALSGVRRFEALLYPGLWAVWGHRLTHRLYGLRIPFLPRALSQFLRGVTGVEIHPGATIGRRLFIDHGAGVVVGETAVIGADVTMYHQVTLGARGWWCDPPTGRRHPSIGDRVVLGVGASVLGPVHIGHDAHIGAHALVMRDVPPHARVSAPRSTVTPSPLAEENSACPSIQAFSI